MTAFRQVIAVDFMSEPERMRQRREVRQPPPLRPNIYWRATRPHRRARLVLHSDIRPLPWWMLFSSTNRAMALTESGALNFREGRKKVAD